MHVDGSSCGQHDEGGPSPRTGAVLMSPLDRATDPDPRAFRRRSSGMPWGTSPPGHRGDVGRRRRRARRHQRQRGDLAFARPAAHPGLLRPRQRDLTGSPQPGFVRGQCARRPPAAPVRQLRVGWSCRGLGRRAAPPRPVGSPRLADVLAIIECTAEQFHPGGDHEIVIGRVRHTETSGSGAAPLVFWWGTYTSLANPA